MRAYENLIGEFTQKEISLFIKQTPPEVNRELININETENIKENNFPISPIGNPEFIKNIYHVIEREFDTKKRHCKFINLF
jgi:hypothetical protein